MDRRRFLRGAAVGAASVPLATWLAACSERRPAPRAGFAPLPDRPELAVAEAPVERDAVLRVYQWKEYLSERVLRSFERSHADRGVRVEVESFQRIDEAVARLASPGADFDVVFPTVDVLPGMVREGLLRPLNHDLLPHLPNLWSWFRSPEGPPYDPGQRYTMPYTVYSSGIAWRADMVNADRAPDRLSEPTDIFLDERYAGLVGFYDSHRDALGLGLQRVGARDLLAPTDDELEDAAAFLADAVEVGEARFTIDGVSEGLAECAFAVHQAWSGDVLTAPRYAAAWEGGEDPADVAAALRYVSPAHQRMVGVDLTAVASTGRFPVAAHAFLDHLLRLDVAMDNFAWNGYQVPMLGVEPEAFDDPSFRWSHVVPANLRSALVGEDAFAAGRMLVGFGPSEEARWLDQFRRVVPS
jgi:spermidine/putrescine transport system substrate-binding protein